jgi:DNA-binding beta-propeller fold protein YncE
VGAAICLGLVAAWMGRAVPGTAVANAQTARTPEQIAEIAAANLRGSEPPPVFELDKTWPKQPLPNNWGLGIVWGVDVDSRDHVWIVHQTASPQYQDQIKKAGKVPAPAVIEFDQQGNVVQAWGTPGQGGWAQGKNRPFPAQAIAVDWKGNVWVSEEARGHAVVKFSREGKFLLQIGEVDKTNGSADTKLLGAPSGMDFDPSANEIYIADGYVNRRIIVFDADTGAYKRHWGRYGLAPDDDFEPGDQPTWLPSPFLIGQPPNKGRFPRYAHGVNVSRDGLVYAADRSHNVLFVHRKDGTYVREAALPGPFNSVSFSPDPEQYYLYATGMNASSRMYILRRSDLQILGSFKSDGQHYMGVDSKGNLFTCGRFMPQRWILKQLPKRTANAR